MWWYKNVTRAEFESAKDKVEKFMLKAGAEVFDTKLPYEQKTTSYSGDLEESHISNRPVFTYNGEYYCVDEMLFRDKPFIVIAFGTKDDLLKNTMEDAEPFPYDLPDDELAKEVSFSMGISPYPEV